MFLNEVVVNCLGDDELVSLASDDRHNLSLVREGKELLRRISPPNRIARIGLSLVDRGF